MAYQHTGKRKGAPINRTPAPDEVTQIRAPQGGSGYGQNAPQPSSVAPGKAVESALGANLRQSQDDGENVLQQVIEKGVAGRGDSVPADGNDQLRDVLDAPLAPAHGLRSRNLPAGSYDTLPAKLGESAKPPVRQPS
jgi:hypothetical protein